MIAHPPPPFSRYWFSSSPLMCCVPTVISLPLVLLLLICALPANTPTCLASSDQVQVGKPAAVRGLGDQSAGVRGQSATPCQPPDGFRRKGFQRGAGKPRNDHKKTMYCIVPDLRIKLHEVRQSGGAIVRLEIHRIFWR